MHLLWPFNVQMQLGLATGRQVSLAPLQSQLDGQPQVLLFSNLPKPLPQC